MDLAYRFAAGFIPSVAGLIGLGYRLNWKDVFSYLLGKVLLYIRFVSGVHSGSSRPVAYLKGARLEQSNGQLKARKRFLLLHQAYARNSCCAVLGHKFLAPQIELERSLRPRVSTSGAYLDLSDRQISHTVKRA